MTPAAAPSSTSSSPASSSPPRPAPKVTPGPSSSSLERARAEKARKDAERKLDAERKAAAAAPPAPLDERTVENAYAGLWLVLSLVVWFYARATHELGELSSAEIQADARALLPILRDRTRLVRVLSWVGAPIVVVRRVKEKLRRKPSATSSPSSPPSSPAEAA